MASQKTLAAVVALIAAVAVFPQATTRAEVYRVGDDSGWDNGVDYAAWASGKQFRVGDTLVFLYAQGSHNVVEVDGQGFQACSVASNAPTLTSGDDKVALGKVGQRFFICGFDGHCQSGMKLGVTVN